MQLELNGEIRLTIEVTQNLSANTSTVRVTKLELCTRDGSTVGSCWLLGEVRLGGTLAANLTRNSTQSCTVNYAAAWDGGGEGTWSGYTCQDLTFTHQSDGTCQTEAQVTLRIYTAASRLADSFTRTATLTLPRLPRASTLAGTAVYLGQTMSLTLTKAADTFTDTVTWQCGSASGTIAERTTQTALGWTPPLDLAIQETAGTQVGVTFTAVTYSGDEQVGTSTLTLALPIPESIIPQVSFSVTDKMGYLSTFGGYIQNQSMAQVTTQAQGQYGATIQSIVVTCGTLSGTGTDTCFALGSSGEITICAVATDSRGRTASAQGTITVLPYAAPTAQITGAYRCDADGNAQADGAYLCLTFTAQVTQLTGSTTAYTARCQVHKGGDITDTALSSLTGAFSASASVVLPADTDNSYDCTILVTDSFGTASSPSAYVGAAFVLMDFCREENAIGLGIRARTAETLTISLTTDMTDHRLTGLAEPQLDTDAATMAYVERRLKELGLV